MGHPAKRRVSKLSLPLPRRLNRLFERRGHVSICGHHVRGLRHVRLAPQPRAYCLAISYGKPAFATYRHSFTGPAMRRRDGNTEIACDGRPTLQRAFVDGRGFLFGILLFTILFL